MSPKLLLFISIVLLFNVNSYASSATDLPALPVNSVIEVAEENSESEISLWQKIKNFFGFGEQEEKVVESNEDDKIAANEDPIEEAYLPDQELQSMDDVSSIPTENLNEETAIKQTIDQVQSENTSFSDKDVNMNDKMNSEDLSIAKGFAEDEALKLPTGFLEDDIKKQDVSELKEIDDSAKSESVRTVFADKTDEIKNDIKQNISDSVEDLKIPGGFEGIKSDDSKEIKLPIIDGEKDKINKAEIAVKQEETKVEIKSSSVPITAESNTVDDSQLKLTTDSNQELITKTDSNLKDQLPTPDYALIPDLPKKEESSISKFARAFEGKKSNMIELPKITEEDFVKNDEGVAAKKESIELDSTQLQFVNNEAQVLILPNDDVVLGKLTKRAHIDNMDLYSYIKKFWQNYNSLEREPKREEIENFIEEYDENFNKEKFV